VKLPLCVQGDRTLVCRDEFNRGQNGSKNTDLELSNEFPTVVSEMFCHNYHVGTVCQAEDEVQCGKEPVRTFQKGNCKG